MNIRRELSKIAWLRTARTVVRTLHEQFGLGLKWVGGIGRFYGFSREYRRLRALNGNGMFALRGRDIYPCLRDRTSATPLEPVYFYQDSWLARKLAASRPAAHVDVASSAKSLALIAQFIPVTMVDIRPVDLPVEGLTFITGSVLALPFTDCSVASLSSICVIEHIGLGRYGDELDAFGSEKAAAELLRVLASGGDLYITVPVDRECRIEFNAHRVFTRGYLLGLFPGCETIEERYIYGREWCEQHMPERGYGTGLYHLRKL